MKRGFKLLLLLLWLGTYGENLALWGETGETPIKVFPYRLEIYPPSDQQALRQKIPLGSREDASRLFEDYFS